MKFAASKSLWVKGKCRRVRKKKPNKNVFYFSLPVALLGLVERQRWAHLEVRVRALLEDAALAGLGLVIVGVGAGSAAEEDEAILAPGLAPRVLDLPVVLVVHGAV